MADERATVAGLTLPPKVVGEVSGHLVMKVDEVLWARKPPGEVSAVVMWWGGEEPTTFRPTDVSQEHVRKRNAGVIYEIRTSLALFEKYLRKCISLEIAMADKYGMPIGCVSVPNLYQMITICPYQGYYPIINNFGNRIGDLHVSFNLRMSASTDTCSSTKPTTIKKSVNSKEPKQLRSLKQPQFIKEAKTKKNEEVVKDDLSTIVSAQKSDSNNDNFVQVESQTSVQNSVSPTSNIISQILKHGIKLRDAMTASVMEDGVQLDLKSVSNLNNHSSDMLEDVRTPQTVDSFPLSNSCLGPCSKNACEKKINPVSEKKVLDYLSGKPMSSLEEEEALSALRNITPTKDILEIVVPDTYRESETEESSKVTKNMQKDLAETMERVTDSKENRSSLNRNECSFEVDSQLLSQINCLRVTVRSLVLNTVGIKRIGNGPKKKGSLIQSNISLHPPGVTYFVEYKFPLASESRTWDSNVRYCSKRFDGHEVTFGDRSVHNIPETWRCSISEEANLCSLISALSFKVCARHLHQRVPVCLGSASPNSAKEVVNSSHLRHDFDLPVIANDCLPVAQLKICIELGRDRIHFGGLLDPENNSLGIRSPRKTSSRSKKSRLSLKNASSKTMGKSVTTVTRNIHSKHSSSVHKWKSVPHQASHADQVIKQLVAHANNAAKPSSLSESSSAPSSARPRLKQLSSSSHATKHQSSAFVPGNKSSIAKPHADVLTAGQHFMKHELAVTLIQVIDSYHLKSSAAENRGFYVSYKFPVSNTMKNDCVDWNTCCTEPSEGSEGIWPKSQNKIQYAVLPKQKAFYVFLEQAFKLQGMQESACVVFALNIRNYGKEVKDLKVAEAYLPLTCILTLEEAYNDASRNNANFSESACSSVVLDLPLEDLPSNQCPTPMETSGSLRLKLDYRHSDVNLMLKGHLPRSRGDSITENLPYYDLAEPQYQKQKPEIEVVLSQSFDSSPTIPNWAKHKKLPSSQLEDTFLISDKISTKCNFAVDKQNSTSRNPHASWEPVEEHTNRSSLHSSAYQLSSSNNPEGHQCIADIIDITKGLGECTLNESPHSGYGSSGLLCVNDSLGHATFKNTSSNAQEKVKKAVDAVTCTSPSMQQKHTSSIGTSPIASSALFSGKAAPGKDKSQQATVESASQGSQTTPRESLKTSVRDVSTSADLNRVLPESAQSSTRSDTNSNVLPRQSIDDVETVEKVSTQEMDSSAPVQKESPEEISTESQGTLPEKELAQNNCDETSNFATSTFQAKIGVECALHLQMKNSPLEIGGVGRNTDSLVFVSINPCGVDGQISAHMGLNPVSISPAVENNGEPEWHWQTEVRLPVDLLVSTVKRLIFKLWNTSKAAHHEKPEENAACLIGFSALDLTVLAAGLPFISGWYNVMDFSGACRGQIKLAVEPLESVAELIDSSSLIFSNDTQSSSPLSMFVAHCAYPEFPSHVTQFPDMRVQKVDPQPSDQAMAAVLSGYQLVRQHLQRHSSDNIGKPQEPTDDGTRSRSNISLQRRTDTIPEASLPDLSEQNMAPTATVSAPSASQPTAEVSRSDSTVDVEKDPSVLLREKLSELDMITRSIKARVLNRVECAKASGSSVAPFGVSLSDSIQNHSETAPSHIGGGDEPEEVVRDQCHTCASNQTANASGSRVDEPNRQRKHKKNLEAFGDHRSDTPMSCSLNEGKRTRQKQRRTWERHEDLIDFGSLSMEDDDVQSPHNEDMSEWLTEAALQQVFNPFLFNNILNSMNPNRSVQVIELDDSDSSDDNDNAAASDQQEPTANVELKEGSNSHSNSCHRWNRRGDETYRKEPAHFPTNQHAPNHRIRSTATCDADSGVDVDLSANFHPGPSRTTAMQPEYNSSHLRSNIGIRTASSEREESSSCSLSSRHQQSTVPSSSSATPSDSPKHTHHQDSGQNAPTAKGRQCSGSCSGHRRNY